MLITDINEEKAQAYILGVIMALLGINKAALVVFDTNEVGNAFWESQGFSVRSDLVYRNKLVSKKEM